MRPLFALIAAAGLAWSTGASAQPAAETRSGPAATAVTPAPTLASTSGTATPGSLAAIAPATPPTQAAAPEKPAKKRLTWEQRFAQANTTGDGRLTLEQAKTGYTTVARHFREIDLDSKGWVTADDIRAWHKAQRAARHAPDAATGTAGNDALRPKPAFHRTFPGPQQQGTSADPAQHPTEGAKSEDPS